MTEELLEKVATLMHEIWTDWMKDMIGSANPMGFGNEFDDNNELIFEGYNLSVSVDQYETWQRQVFTKYELLSNREQETKRKPSRKLLEMLAENYMLFSKSMKEN